MNARLPLAGGKVLLRLPSWLGDLVQSLPAVHAVASRLAPERLSLAGPRHLLSLLDPDLLGVRRIPHEGRGGEVARAWRGHQTAILFTGSFRSAWTAYRAGIGRRVGHARDGRGWFLTDGLHPARERGAAPFGIARVGKWPRYLPRPFGMTCLELLGSVGIEVPDPRPRLVVERERGGDVRTRLGLASEEPYVVASVGARPGSSKGFGASAWVRTLDELGKTLTVPILLTAGPGEEDAAREVAAGLRTARGVPVVDPVSDLGELAALFADAKLVLATDSGPRHLAVAAGAPVACVFGSTDPRHSADNLGRQRLLRREVACGPCHQERCPLAGAQELRCMRDIDPLELAHRALGLVE